MAPNTGGLLTEALFESFHLRFDRCLAPGPHCGNPAIRAHSIQNSRVLDVLAEDGHVMMFQATLTVPEGPRIELKRVGRNNATTFTGLCSTHDNQIFAPIDIVPIDVTNPEHCFLLAYRSVLREFHAKLRAWNRTQLFYQEAVRLGRASPTPPDPAGQSAMWRAIDAYSFYRYVFEIDQWFPAPSFNEIESKSFILPNTGPVLGVSAAFGFVNNLAVLKRRLDPEFVILNVFPENNDTRVVYSYKTRQRDDLIPHLHRMLSASGDYQRYLICKEILANCENFVISPSHHAKLSPDQLDAMTTYFSATVMDADAEMNSPHLLFF